MVGGIVTGWNSYGYTPDYFNMCSSGTTAVPSNIFGYQWASTGNGYTGLYAHIIGQSSNTREYIGRQLSSPLVPGQTYYVNFKTVFSDLPGYDCPCNRLGILFSTQSFSIDSICPPPCGFTLLPPQNRAHIYSTSIINDTINWTLVSDTFTADSAYQYIIIGNHFDDTSITYVDLNTSANCAAYYYIDDITVIPDSLTGIENSVALFLYNVFPNPAFDLLNIQITNVKKYSFSLFDLYGNEVIKNLGDQKTKTVNIYSLPTGIYILVIDINSQKIYQKIIHINNPN